MNCSEARVRLAGYVDDELSAGERVEVEAHTHGCADCRRERSVQWFFHRALPREGRRHKAPPALRRRIRAALRAVGDAPPAPWWRRWSVTLPVPALGGAVAALVAANAILLAGVPSGEDRLADDVIAGHVRAMAGSHPIEVASSDRHTVKPWYVGKLDFSPPVTDFAADGYPLAGGRVDFVGGRTVAALVYERREHMIDVYTWPAPPSTREPLAEAQRRGFNVLHWTAGGMTYWLASDLEMAEMKRLAALLEAHRGT
jgi:anti-sigma factor RsiW